MHPYAVAGSFRHKRKLSLLAAQPEHAPADLIQCRDDGGEEQGLVRAGRLDSPGSDHRVGLIQDVAGMRERVVGKQHGFVDVVVLGKCLSFFENREQHPLAAEGAEEPVVELGDGVEGAVMGEVEARPVGCRQAPFKLCACCIQNHEEAGCIVKAGRCLCRQVVWDALLSEPCGDVGDDTFSACLSLLQQAEYGFDGGEVIVAGDHAQLFGCGFCVLRDGLGVAGNEAFRQVVLDEVANCQDVVSQVGRFRPAYCGAGGGFGKGYVDAILTDGRMGGLTIR